MDVKKVEIVPEGVIVSVFLTFEEARNKFSLKAEMWLQQVRGFFENTE